jgi:hypothetical protein
MTHPFKAEKLHFLSFAIESAEIKSPFGFNPELVIKHDFKLNWDMSFDMEGNIIKADLGVTILKVIKKKKRVVLFK